MLNDQSRAEKYLRAMHCELARLQARRRHPPVHALIPPIQRGWKRHYVLSDAARKQPDAELLAAILARIDTVRYFWQRDFRPGRRRRARNTISIEQILRVFSIEQWRREAIPAEWRRYFRPEIVPRTTVDGSWRYRQRGPWIHPLLAKPRRGYLWAYVFRQPEMYSLRVEKHWLTHYSEVEPEVSARIAEVERWMEPHHRHARFRRLQGHSWRSWRAPDPRRKCREHEARREMRAHLGFLGNEAAEHIPSKTPCWGARRTGCVQPPTFGRHGFSRLARRSPPRSPRATQTGLKNITTSHAPTIPG